MAISEKARLNLPHLPAASSSIAEEVYTHVKLPETPSIKIRAGNPGPAIELRELWAHRELLYFLVWRDLKVRYKQTILGASWVILQPVLMTLVFAIFLGKIARVPSGRIPYVLFLYTGLLPWTFFSNAVSSSSHSLIASAQMITKVYFPRAIVPMATVLVRLSDFVIASTILVVLMLYYRQAFTSTILLAPLLMIHLTLLASGLGMWFAALNVKYRDIGTALPVIIQLWMFASPIVYPTSLVAQNWRWAYELNPLVGLIEGFRAVFLGLNLNYRSLAVSGAITLALLVYSTYAFKRLEDEFADVV